MTDEPDSGQNQPQGGAAAPPGWSPPPGYQPPGYGPPPGYPPQGYGLPPQGYPPPGYGPSAWGPPGPGWGPPGYPVPQKNSEKAVVVMITGIASIVVFFTCLLGIIPAIVALCMAPGARQEIRESRGALGGDGLLKAGVICSWVTIGLTVLAIVAFAVFLSAFSWSITNSTTF